MVAFLLIVVIKMNFRALGFRFAYLMNIKKEKKKKNEKETTYCFVKIKSSKKGECKIFVPEEMESK